MQSLKKTSKNIVSVALVLTYATGCATNPDRLGSTYVSPVQYNAYNCDQILAEKVRVERRVTELTGKQAKASKNDKVAMGVGLVLFWPALFFLAGSDHAEELKRLKGEYEALDIAWIESKCADTVTPPVESEITGDTPEVPVEGEKAVDTQVPSAMSESAVGQNGKA
jgi:hypothetical protein